MLNPRIAVTINGNPYTLAFDFGAALTLQKEFNISWQDLDRFRKPGAKEAEDLELLAKLVYAMTRSSEPAPSMTEIQRMSLVELAGLRDAIVRGMVASLDSNLGENRPAGAKPGAAAGGRSGTGAKRSRRR
jgi:hypothetical protein